MSSAVRSGALSGCSDPFDTGTPVDLAQLEQRQVVLANLLHRNVSRGRGDADEFGLGAGEQIDQRHRVVDARVDVDEHG